MASSPDAKTTVQVLIKGYVEGDRATGTVSLVTTSEGKVILVDAGDPWNGEELLAALAERGFAPYEVTDVVITHGHIDHCGNVSRFRRARFFMDGDWAHDGVYGQREEYHTIAAGVVVQKRVGHTASDLIVIVSDTERGGTTVIAGDLFEDEHDEDKWRPNSAHPDKHKSSRAYIRDIADWIVPGHGDIFRVDKALKGIGF